MKEIDRNRLFATHMAKLNSLEKAQWPEQGRFRALYFEATECIRSYLNRQYGLDMKDRSVEELERILGRLRGPSSLLQELRNLFAEREKVEQAQWLPSMREARKVPERARQLLSKLAPPEVRAQQSKESQNELRGSANGKRGSAWIMPAPAAQSERQA